MAAAIQTVTLVADTASAVTFDQIPLTYELVHTANLAQPVYLRTDGVTAVKEADENDVLLGSERIQYAANKANGASLGLSIISAGAVVVVIRALA